MTVQFTCKGCGTVTTLRDALAVPSDELCPPCFFFGADWEDDEALVRIVDDMQERNKLQ